jgi:MOSC domain-containing protein YiiM
LRLGLIGKPSFSGKLVIGFMDTRPIVASIFIGKPKQITDAAGIWTSSIFRNRVEGPVELRPEGVVGDQVTQPYHGGRDSAVCVHLLDHYRFWKQNYGVDLPPGAAGENFTLDHISESEICAGDVVRAGSAVVQVSGPRIPCAHLARRVGRPDWAQLSIAESRTGFYCRVLDPGTTQPGDAWFLLERLNPQASISALNYCFYVDFDPDYARQVADMPAISVWWKKQFLKKLANLAAPWSEGI